MKMMESQVHDGRHRRWLIGLAGIATAKPNDTTAVTQMTQCLRSAGWRIRRIPLRGGTGQLVMHEFLCASPPKPVGDRPTPEYIIDFRFKDHFRVVRPTDRLVAMLSRVEEVFIGTIDLLEIIVEVLARDVKDSLEAQQLCVPPWRTKSYILAAYRRALTLCPTHDQQDHRDSPDNFL